MQENDKVVIRMGDISSENDPELARMARELDDILHCKCGVCEYCLLDDEEEETESPLP